MVTDQVYEADVSITALNYTWQSISGTSQFWEYEEKRTRYMGYRTAQITLCILGLVGNVGVILAWTASRRTTPIVVLMTSLAVWDVGLLFTYLYFCVRNFQWWHMRTNIDQYPWSGSLYQMGFDPAMYFATLGFNCSVCTSVFTVLVISIVRYIAVVRPLVVRRICSRSRMKYLIAGIIFASLLLSFCFCLKYLCLSFPSTSTTEFCDYVARHKRAFLYPDFIIIGMLPWIGTIPLSALLVIHVTKIPSQRSIRRRAFPAAAVEVGARRVTLQVICMVLLSTFTYPVSTNIFLAMEQSPDWAINVKETLYLISDFLLIINPIAHIFLFCAGGTFFRSLMYARFSYLCTCVCNCFPIFQNGADPTRNDLIMADDARFNVSSTRDAVNSDSVGSFRDRQGSDVTRL